MMGAGLVSAPPGPCVGEEGWVAPPAALPCPAQLANLALGAGKLSLASDISGPGVGPG